MTQKMNVAQVEQFGQPLAAINSLFQHLGAGDAPSRAVLDFSSH